MEKYCECEIYFKSFKDVINYFMKQYGTLLKIKSKDITNKKKYDNLEKVYLSLKQMIESLPDKGNNCISFMKKCSKEHKEQLEEITTKLSQIDILSQRIEDYHKKLIKEIPEELEEFSDEEEEKVDQRKNNKINNDDEEEEDEEEIYARIDVKKTMRNDQKNITIIKNLLENEELKAKRDEEKRELIKIKNQLDDLWNNIEVELNKQGEQIDNIEENVDNGMNQVIEGNDDELEKAAISAVNRRRLAYQGGLALAFGAAGSIVPGIGNVIGAALGGLIGYGIYRADKHRLNKVLKKKKKMRDERNDENK